MSAGSAMPTRLPGLDLLRAIAVLWTMQFHSFIVGGLGEDWRWLERYGWMGVDLFFGIKKAKENGLATTSTGFKKTCDKARKYFSPFMVTVCIDLIACTVLPFPVFSMIWAGYCVFCEFVSVREKSWQKAEIRKQDRTMQVILENKDEIAKAVVEIMKEERKKGGDNENN